MLNSFKLPSNFSNVSNKSNIPRCSYVAAQLKFLFHPSGRDKQSIDSRGVFHQNGDSTQTGQPIEEEKNQELLLSDVPSVKLSEGLAAESLFLQIASIFTQISKFSVGIARGCSKQTGYELFYQYLKSVCISLKSKWVFC